MERLDNLAFCIRYLMQHNGIEAGIPDTLSGRQRLLRALMNVWQPQPLSDEFLLAQDRELKAQRDEKGVVTPTDIAASEIHDGPDPQTDKIILWQGDITRLRVDAIVNAANTRMLGCQVPLHGCIDNAIHSAAGLQLRQECARQMQGGLEPTGEARVTQGYNLPAKYVIHTVGPIIPDGKPTPAQEAQLSNCYRHCFASAEMHHCRSIAFCCISTGEFCFPNRRAAEIAIEQVRICMAASQTHSLQTVVFNVFKDIDYDIYRELLGTS